MLLNYRDRGNGCFQHCIWPLAFGIWVKHKLSHSMQFKFVLKRSLTFRDRNMMRTISIFKAVCHFHSGNLKQADQDFTKVLKSAIYEFDGVTKAILTNLRTLINSDLVYCKEDDYIMLARLMIIMKKKPDFLSKVPEDFLTHFTVYVNSLLITRHLSTCRLITSNS
jgi:hypothetical protein